MPFTSNRGQAIHFTVEGEGPLVILQHGFFDNAASWEALGYVAALKDSFTVACVDSLGHGLSDKPLEAGCYEQEQRAGDIVAVLDALKQETAHVVGYSMGGWLGAGVARFFPERLSSLVVGGWDCVNGMSTATRAMGLGAAELEFETFFAGASQFDADLIGWVTPHIAMALAPCFEALYDLTGNAEAVCGLHKPVLLWNGTEDPYHDPMQRFAQERGFDFLSTTGDHLGAMIDNAPGTAEQIRRFLERAA